MSYSVSRRTEAGETTQQHLEAGSAVRLLRTWAAAYPNHELLIRDQQGLAVAYRRPQALLRTATVAQAL
jgi:hypothetical protein